MLTNHYVRFDPLPNIKSICLSRRKLCKLCLCGGVTLRLKSKLKNRQIDRPKCIFELLRTIVVRAWACTDACNPMMMMMMMMLSLLLLLFLLFENDAFCDALRCLAQYLPQPNNRMQITDEIGKKNNWEKKC